ncbi:MAG: hypothetical protein JW993_00695 [Sedimentisphaerales bacterium]|nr:hypothetical protein [Sedimentisphaerales bacterium]
MKVTCGCVSIVSSGGDGDGMRYESELSVLLGAAVGGLLGYLLFFALARRGYHALAVPGGFLGLGAAIFKTKSKPVPIVCGLAALALGLFAEWRLAPFIADAGLGYFLLHVPQLPPFTLVMLGAGATIGFYVPFRRGQVLRGT